MRKILFEFPGHGQGRLFDPATRDNVAQPFRYLRGRLRDLGYDLVTADQLPIKDVAFVWFWDVPPRPASRTSSLVRSIRRALGHAVRRELLDECIRDRLRERLVLFLWEPAVVNPANWDPANWQPFKVIFTWADDIVDNSRFVKLLYPVPGVHPDVPRIAFHAQRLLANISANKHSSHPAELYGARRSLIRYCEAAIPGQFALFGPGWNATTDPHPCYEGTPRNKWEIYPWFRFGLCYENMAGAAGYVTEKIIDCMRGGAVPVYFGAPNIADYVDREAFIDRRLFGSDKELIEFLVGVDETTHSRYREAARAFLASDRFRLFLPQAFADNIIDHAGLR